MAEVRSADVANYIKTRTVSERGSTVVSGSTVARELCILSKLFRHARHNWGFEGLENPCPLPESLVSSDCIVAMALYQVDSWLSVARASRLAGGVSGGHGRVVCSQARGSESAWRSTLPDSRHRADHVLSLQLRARIITTA